VEDLNDAVRGLILVKPSTVFPANSRKGQAQIEACSGYIYKSHSDGGVGCLSMAYSLSARGSDFRPLSRN